MPHNYSGVNEVSGERVAIKAIKMSSVDNEVTQYLLRCETDALLNINHPHVIRAYDIIQTAEHCNIVTPLCEGGSLKDEIKRKGMGESMKENCVRKRRWRLCKNYCWDTRRSSVKGLCIETLRPAM